MSLILPTNTVYSVIWPNTESVVRNILQNETEELLGRHRFASSKVQDDAHLSFFDTWRDWVSGKVVGINSPLFRNMYPCAGSSEGIREVIRTLVSHSQKSALIVFDGEYEGYTAYAESQGTPIYRVNRHNWRQQLEQWGTQGTPWDSNSHVQFWVSQPSSIDGNHWHEFNSFVKTLEAQTHTENLKLWVDFCYLGIAQNQIEIDIDSPIIAGFAFSLSKIFGVYYRRIGGIVSKESIDGLWGNMCFKNLDSLYIGEELIKSTSFDTLSNNTFLVEKQREFLDEFKKSELCTYFKKEYSEDIDWKPSDVPILIHFDNGQNPIENFDKDFDESNVYGFICKRSARTQRNVRLCLTPYFEEYYERK